MKYRAISFTLALLAIGLALPSTASAQSWGGYGFGAGPYGYGFAGVSSPYATGRIPTPPYFALHPPVYYSAPVARTYGYSPFAYPGTVCTPEIAPVDVSTIITNPYVEPSEAEETDTKEQETSTTSAKTKDFASKAKMILNPYVTVETPAETKLARIDYAD